MASKIQPPDSVSVALTHEMLHALNVPIHRLGYRHLTVAIVRFSQGDMHSLTKELYPYLASYFGYKSWHAVENSIRGAIIDAWNNGDTDVWRQYFSYAKKPPTNKCFLATLAERLQQNTPPTKE